MSRDTLNEGSEIAALKFYLHTAERLHHDVQTMFAGIRQHRDAAIATIVNDALTLSTIGICSDCGAVGGDPCHPDCPGQGI